MTSTRGRRWPQIRLEGENRRKAESRRPAVFRCARRSGGPHLFLPPLFAFAWKERTMWPFLVLWGAAALAGHAVSGGPESGIVVAVPYFLSGIIAYIGFMHRVPWVRSWLFLPVIIALAVTCSTHSFASVGSWAAILLLGLVLPSFWQASNAVWKREPIGSRSILTVSTSYINGRWGRLSICLSIR